MKLQSKLLLVVVPLIVTPLLTLGWLAYGQLRDTFTEKTFKEMSTLLDQLTYQINAVLETTEANIDLFSNSAILQRYMLISDESIRYSLLQSTLLKLFNGYQQAYPDYYEIRILLTNGYEDTRATLGPIPNITEEEANSAYFQALQRQRSGIYSSVLINPDNGKPALIVGKPLLIKSPSIDPAIAKPELRGYLVITRDLDFLQRHVQENRIGDKGFIFYVDSTAQIIFHPQSNQIGEHLPAHLFSRLQAAKASQNPVIGDYLNTKLYFQIRQLHPDLYLIASLPRQDLLATGQRLGNLVAVITVIATLLTAALLIIALQYLLVTPIKKLSRATQAISQGTPVNVDIVSGDEIGDLARSFNEMADNLESFKNQISYLAYHDSLTGLPNRLLVKEHLNHALAYAKRAAKPLALLFLDLDGFKRINDTLGHSAGDELLKQVAQILTASLRGEDYVARGKGGYPAESEYTGDIVARLGGDEFLILLRELSHIHDVEKVVKRLIKVLSAPFKIEQSEVFISASVGITLFPMDGKAAETLIQNADMAMYHAKMSGRNNFQYFSESMNANAAQRLLIDTKLRKALVNNELQLYYQPQIDINTTRIVGCEALLRWHDKELGWMSPATFVPLIEETGLIIPISEWVLTEACQQAKEWQLQGFADLHMSVNISGIHINRADLRTLINRALEESGLQPRFLDIELTETSIVTSEEKAITVLNDVKALGINISLDDFGTGYSSLNHLRRFPVDRLKIDGSFLRNLPFKQDDVAIVSAIIAMAHSLKLQVTAEGVETDQQFEFLRERRCDCVQGYLFSRPLPRDAMTALLSEKHKRAFR